MARNEKMALNKKMERNKKMARILKRWHVTRRWHATKRWKYSNVTVSHYVEKKPDVPKMERAKGTLEGLRGPNGVSKIQLSNPA